MAANHNHQDSDKKVATHFRRTLFYVAKNLSEEDLTGIKFLLRGYFKDGTIVKWKEGIDIFKSMLDAAKLDAFRNTGLLQHILTIIKRTDLRDKIDSYYSAIHQHIEREPCIISLYREMLYKVVSELDKEEVSYLWQDMHQRYQILIDSSGQYNGYKLITMLENSRHISEHDVECLFDLCELLTENHKPLKLVKAYQRTLVCEPGVDHSGMQCTEPSLLVKGKPCELVRVPLLKYEHPRLITATTSYEQCNAICSNNGQTEHSHPCKQAKIPMVHLEREYENCYKSSSILPPDYLNKSNITTGLLVKIDDFPSAAVSSKSMRHSAADVYMESARSPWDSSSTPSSSQSSQSSDVFSSQSPDSGDCPAVEFPSLIDNLELDEHRNELVPREKIVKKRRLENRSESDSASNQPLSTKQYMLENLDMILRR